MALKTMVVRNFKDSQMSTYQYHFIQDFYLFTDYKNFYKDSLDSFVKLGILLTKKPKGIKGTDYYIPKGAIGKLTSYALNTHLNNDTLYYNFKITFKNMEFDNIPVTMDINDLIESTEVEIRETIKIKW